MNRRTRQRGFTLAELLVVIAIIALLIGIALPAFKSARTAAKKTATAAVITSIEAGLTAYREERALGNVYPPSASDKVDDYPWITHPTESPSGGNPEVKISGASLLVYALAGARLQGTPGFKKVGSFPYWADAMTGESGMGGLYDIQKNPPWPTYGPFAGANLLDRVSFLFELTKFPVDKLEAWVGASDLSQVPDLRQYVFVDDFGGPILYYKARPAARNMITEPDTRIGIYDYRDNRVLTEYEGSLLRGTRYDVPPAPFGNGFGLDRPPTQFDQFDRFILDTKASRRSGTNPNDPYVIARPVRPDSFLLISAGPDLLFGTKDDIVNWTRD